METEHEKNIVEPDVPLFETSPDGSLDAIVQQDQRTVYLYLHGRDGQFGTRACWVRNLIGAPIEMSRSDLEQGIPPVLSRFATNHPQGAAPPAPNHLRIVWFEEGNGVALLEHDDVLAVIPPWSGQEGFHGYARDCIAESEVCWPMPSQPALRERISRAEQLWSDWKSGSPFQSQRDALLAIYRRRFGMEFGAFQVDPEHWPPLWLYRFPTAQGEALVSIGMSLRPQPNVELSQERPAAVRRIELGIAFQPGHGIDSAEQATELLAGQARYPWRKWNWLGHGHVATLTRAEREAWHFLFVSDRPRHGELLRYRDDPVNLLWMVPITAAEAAQAGGNVAAVIKQCIAEGRIAH